MTQKSAKLSLVEGVSIGIGSIIGSGVLFLPSMTLSLAGADALLGWILIIFICIPGLFFLVEMVDEKSNDGIAGFISKGLGKDIGNTIPILLLGTVTIGMPSSAIVVGRYVQYSLPTVPHVDKFIPFVMIISAIFICLKGVKTSAKMNTVIASMLIIVGLTLFTNSFKQIDVVKLPSFSFDHYKIINSAILAFWAFAGFENLTFLAGNFQNPRRDLLISATVAVVLCGAIYLGLTYNILMLVPLEQVQSTAGLMQLAEFIRPQSIALTLLASFSFFAVMMNLISWTAGVSNAMLSSAEKGMLPVKFQVVRDGVAIYCIYFLCGAFFLSLIIGLTSPNLFELMVSTVSSNFLLIYLLCLVSYLNFTTSKIKKSLCLVFVTILLAVLLSHGYLLFYPAIIVIIGYWISKKRA